MEVCLIFLRKFFINFFGNSQTISLEIQEITKESMKEFAKVWQKEFTKRKLKGTSISKEWLKKIKMALPNQFLQKKNKLMKF